MKQNIYSEKKKNINNLSLEYDYLLNILLEIIIYEYSNNWLFTWTTVKPIYVFFFVLPNIIEFNISKFYYTY